MKSNTFGLDIGISTIKAVWFNREKEIITYNSALSTPTPTPGLQSESPFDHQDLAQAINKLINDAKITSTKVVIALPESHIFTKMIDMPAISEKELSTAIYWEAEEHIPAPIETMSLAWNVVNRPKTSGNGQMMQVLLVAAPIQLIKRYQTILDLAGLSVVAVETELLSIIRGLFKGPSSPTSIIMNIGSLSTSIAIVQGGVIVFTYSIPLGGTAMTRAIASDFGLSIAQAEEYKKTYGLSDKNLGGKIGIAIDPIFSNLLTELRKAIAFYNEKYKNESPISQIVLSGGSAKMPGIDIYFVKNIGIETVIANPWKMMNVQGVPESLQRQGPEYAVACGLALKEYE
ncbi:MAG TPA: type IV pilus assembly protein PilM [Candidatus Limnocylindrales bacterium]|nr:type IV pilus assembly protein PilM [Candidatus Limnocylindrales bacterium]